MKRVATLIIGTLALWVAAAYPAWLLGGEEALAHSAVALILCIVPTTATLLWAEWTTRQSPEQQLTMVLGGTGIRLGLVMGVGLLLYTLVPFFGKQSFWIWLLIFYLFTLALEMVLVVRSWSAAEGQQGPISARSGS
jgi:hypothetical protein